MTGGIKMHKGIKREKYGENRKTFRIGNYIVEPSFCNIGDSSISCEGCIENIENLSEENKIGIFEAQKCISPIDTARAGDEMFYFRGKLSKPTAKLAVERILDVKEVEIVVFEYRYMDYTGDGDDTDVWLEGCSKEHKGGFMCTEVECEFEKGE